MPSLATQTAPIHRPGERIDRMAAIIAADPLFALCLRMRPDCRPGERRLKDGKLYVYDANLLNRYRAWTEVFSAPSDLTALSESELRGLRSASLEAWWQAPRDPDANALQSRIGSEFMRRFGGSC